MEEVNIDRPKVTEVKVTVKSEFQSPVIRTEFEYLTNVPINEGKFPYWPKLHLPGVQPRRTEGTKSFPGDPNNLVLFIEEGVAFFDPNVQRINVEVENGAELDDAKFEYFDERP